MTPGRGARLFLLSGPLWFATGCLSMGTVQTASTLGKGNFQISAEPGAYGLTLPNSSGPGYSPEVVPHFDVAFRYGVNDRFDIGVRTGWSLIELQAKVLLTDPDAERLAISLAPTLGGTFGSSQATLTMPATNITAFNFSIPVLFGIKHFRANEFVVGPRINNMLFALRDGTGSAAIYVFGLGGTIGYSFAIGEIFRILPELGLSIPVASSSQVGAAAIAGSGLGNFLWQLKVGLMFGRAGKRPPDVVPQPPPEPPPVEQPPPPPDSEFVPAPMPEVAPPPPPPPPDPVQPGP